MMQDIEYKQFKVIQAIAQERICRNKVYWNSEELFNRIRKPGLDDASVILRIFEKQLKEHNTKLDADESRVRNLNYKSKNVYKSKYFIGINIEKVFKAVRENPDAEIWGIVKEII